MDFRRIIEFDQFLNFYVVSEFGFCKRLSFDSIS